LTALTGSSFGFFVAGAGTSTAMTASIATPAQSDQLLFRVDAILA
jgi:hypothetical protein